MADAKTRNIFLYLAPYENQEPFYIQHMQRTIFTLFLIGTGFFFENRVNAQQNEFQPYRQEIPGTGLSFKLVPVPAGKFAMGSPEDEKGHGKDESPRHPVKLDAFWMAEFEMTWDIFERFVNGDNEPGTDAVARPTKPYLDMTFGMGKGKHPAIGMTQYGAVQFCKWLYQKTGVFYRLPTEAEWEYACRAGSTGAYAFGSDESLLDEHAWYRDNSGEKTHPAGSKKPNEWGLYDMHGNVMEWTYDQYAPDTYRVFEGKTASNPVAEPSELYPHSLRGGSYKDSPEELRSANRIPSRPEWKQIDPQVPKSNWWFPEAPFVGFRVVRPLMPPSKEEIEAYYNKEPIQDY